MVKIYIIEILKQQVLSVSQHWPYQLNASCTNVKKSHWLMTISLDGQQH